MPSPADDTRRRASSSWIAPASPVWATGETGASAARCRGCQLMLSWRLSDTSIRPATTPPGDLRIVAEAPTLRTDQVCACLPPQVLPHSGPPHSGPPLLRSAPIQVRPTGSAPIQVRPTFSPHSGPLHRLLPAQVRSHRSALPQVRSQSGPPPHRFVSSDHRSPAPAGCPCCTPLQVRPPSPAQVRPSQVRPHRSAPLRSAPCAGPPPRVRPAQVRPIQVRPAQVRPTQVRPAQVRARRSAPQVRPRSDSIPAYRAEAAGPRTTPTRAIDAAESATRPDAPPSTCRPCRVHRGTRGEVVLAPSAHALCASSVSLSVIFSADILHHRGGPERGARQCGQRPGSVHEL